jgi:uncharacterized damage-inducible protein DinB
MPTDSLLLTWETHNRILLHLLEAIPEMALSGTASNGGRSVGQMFAHLHNVRLMWLEAADPSTATRLEKVPARKKDGYTLAQLRAALLSSGAAMARLFEQGMAAGRIMNVPMPPAVFYSYLVAHEWYHIGEIGIALTQSGHPLDETTAYAIWQWNQFTPG